MSCALFVLLDTGVSEVFVILAPALLDAADSELLEISCLFSKYENMYLLLFK